MIMILVFLAGLTLGSVFGFLCAAILTAGRLLEDEDDERYM